MNKLRLVDGWKQSYKWYSMAANSVAVSFLAVWALVPERMQEAFSPTELKVMAIVFIVAAMFGRLIKQGEDNAD